LRLLIYNIWQTVRGVKMPSVIKYCLFLMADLAIIGFIVHFTFCSLRGKEPIVWGRPGHNSIKEHSHLLAVMFSFGLVLYGALVFLFSWMPDQWITYYEDGDQMRTAESLAGTAALMGAFALPQVLTDTQAKFVKLNWELDRLKGREASADAFERELSTMLQWFQSPGLQADVFVRLERAIDEAEKGYDREQEQIYRNLLNVFQKARGAPSPAIPL
jgi:hypothetical protein